ncbi:MAG TPA: hypothetical protein PKE47_17650 [Verrucomicrobiota bacterium]|nr:hypothetical protein [Verrucomicrobiota bacterium]
MNSALGRIRAAVATVIVGLVLSGLTAIPIPEQFASARRALGEDFTAGGAMPEYIRTWLVEADRGVQATTENAPFVWYGTDWLAFGHLVIALAFVGAWRDPVRNRWLFDFGLIACAAVIPWALTFGALRGIPIWWRLVDCSFGVLGALPLWLARRWTRELAGAAA